MILPTKHIPPRNALIAVGETVLRALERPTTPSSLWELLRTQPELGSWSRFVLTLDLLHILGVVEFQNGLLTRVELR